MIVLAGLVLEAVVAVLLVVTIIYCIMLDRRIRSFKSEQINLAGLVAQLSNATDHAEVAVAGLKTTAEEADGELDSKLKKARSLSEELAFMVETGNNLAGKLADPARRGEPARGASAADNVAYLKPAANPGVRAEKREPAFTNSAASPAQASEMAPERSERGEKPAARVRTQPHTQTRKQRQPMDREAGSDGRVRSRTSSQAPSGDAGAVHDGREVRQTLAQALRYAR